MSDPMTDYEVRLARAVESYLERAELGARPSAVVADVVGRPAAARSRFGLLLPAALATGVVVLVVGAVLWAPWLDGGTAPGTSPSPSPTQALAPAPTSSAPAPMPITSPTATSSATTSPSPLSPLAIETVPAFERTYRVGGMDVTLRGDRLVDTAGGALLSRGFFWPWLPVDRATLVVGAGFQTIATVRDSIWLADLTAGRLTPISEGGPLLLLDVRDERILVGRPGSLLVLDHDGRQLASLATDGPVGVFLADGTLAVVSGGRIGVWDAVEDGVSWSRLPSGLGHFTITAAGMNVVAVGDAGYDTALDGRLIDPRTGEQIGDAWRAGAGWAVAVSPDGTRFAADVTTDELDGAIEVRDSATGELIARNAGRPMTQVEKLFWPTDDVILALRSDTGTDAMPVPELYLAEAFAEGPLQIDPLLDAEEALYYGNGDIVVAVGEEGEVLRVTIEAPAGRP